MALREEVASGCEASMCVGLPGGVHDWQGPHGSDQTARNAQEFKSRVGVDGLTLGAWLETVLGWIGLQSYQKSWVTKP
ncbi:hypothetical protein E2562_030345 [Oryza meyeriana var. granulata]|uniref:Uncharacterized protein n=1 Tax=Oryza meyeriana var. granulata TaxID=110450 RepID=A0A6G1DB64_9ORYZ|nr:hypothetical protein E2562_030345 [Oryza meyeriana var. granulata]